MDQMEKDYEAQFASINEYAITLNLVIQAQHEKQAIESLQEQFAAWLKDKSTIYEIYDIEIQSAEEM